MALNLFRRDDTRRLSLASKRLRAGWGNDFLLKLVPGVVP